MMHESSHGELVARDAFMHHGNQGHSTLKHYAAPPGLKRHPPVMALHPMLSCLWSCVLKRGHYMEEGGKGMGCVHHGPAQGVMFIMDLG